MKVPEGCECTLLVPRLSFESRLSLGKLSINDPEGTTVMRASFSTDQGSGPSTLPLPAGAWRLSLYDPGCGPMGFCQEEQADSQQQLSLTLHEARSGRVFALLQSSTQYANGYEACGYGGWRLHLCPTESSDGSGWTFTNERSQLLAVAESKGESSHRTVRIDSGVDTSVIVLTLMGMDVLDSNDNSGSGRRHAPQRQPSR